MKKGTFIEILKFFFVDSSKNFYMDIILYLKNEVERKRKIKVRRKLGLIKNEHCQI